MADDETNENATTADKIAANGVTTAKLTADAVATDKLTVDSVQAGNVTALAGTAGKDDSDVSASGVLAPAVREPESGTLPPRTRIFQY